MGLFNSLLTTAIIVALVWALALFQPVNAEQAVHHSAGSLNSSMSSEISNLKNTGADLTDAAVAKAKLLIDKVNSKVAEQESASQLKTVVLDKVGEQTAKLNQMVHQLKATSETKAKPKTDSADEIINISGITERLPLSALDSLWLQFDKASQLHGKLKRTPNKVYVVYRDFSDNFDRAKITIGYDVSQLKRGITDEKINLSALKPLLAKQSYSMTELKAGWEQVNYGPSLNRVVEIHTLNSKGKTIASELFVAYK